MLFEFVDAKAVRKRKRRDKTPLPTKQRWIPMELLTLPCGEELAAQGGGRSRGRGGQGSVGRSTLASLANPAWQIS